MYFSCIGNSEKPVEFSWSCQPATEIPHCLLRTGKRYVSGMCICMFVCFYLFILSLRGSMWIGSMRKIRKYHHKIEPFSEIMLILSSKRKRKSGLQKKNISSSTSIVISPPKHWFRAVKSSPGDIKISPVATQSIAHEVPQAACTCLWEA